MDTIRTVSDTKRDFYSYHNRPINSIYRQVVEELLVEMHLLSVNVDFRKDSIYSLGVVSAFDRFLQGYKPLSDKDSIFNALCQSVGSKPENYRQDAQSITSIPDNWTMDGFIEWLQEPSGGDETQSLKETINQIRNNSYFKYSRLFAIGLYTLIDKIDSEVVKDNDKRNKILDQISEILGFSKDKIQKDLDIYRSNLEKMEQVLLLIQEGIQSDRKKREQRQSQNSNNSEESSSEESQEE